MRREFSRLVRADQITEREAVHDIAATPAECAALAVRFGLVALDRLVASVRLRRIQGGTLVRASGVLDAVVVQSCVVSLEPVPATIRDSFTARFESEASGDDEAEWRWAGVEIDIDPLEEDDPEPIEDGRIDLGEWVAQHLSLALDPYPRAPDAVFKSPADDRPRPPPASPLTAGLARWRRGS
jgi:uncharacterized metal-binding protein YceD (DUF177 family)